METGFLNTNSFTLEIVRIPLIKYTIQQLTFPDITLSEIPQPTPLQTINQVGDHIMHDNFSFTFLVDEKMRNYNVIYQWMRGLSFPHDYKEYAKFIKGAIDDTNIKTFGNDERLNQFSDTIVTIYSNQKNPVVRYRFFDAFPVSLSGLNLSVTESDVQPVTATCTMKFTGFEIEPL